MNDGYGLIYISTNKINNLSYIGQSVEFNKRKAAHKNSALGVRKEDGRFYNAIRKYGWSNFEWNILYDYIPKRYLSIMEKFCISMYNTYNNGYNMTEGGEIPPNHKNKKRSDETKKRISAGRTGIKFSEEHRRNISISHKGKITWIKGKSHSQETKEKISKIQIGRPGNRKGKSCSEECRMKMSEARKKLPSHILEAKSEEWEIINPDGKIEIIKNLAKFCKENNLTNSAMCLVAKGKKAHHKKYKCRKIKE